MKSRSKSGLKQTSSFGKKIIISVIVILIILAVSLFLIGRNYLKSSLKPLDAKSTRITQLDIPFGASDRKIGSILQNHKIVKNGLVFNYFIKSHNIKNLRAGYYRLSPSMKLSTITRILKRGGAKYPVDTKHHVLRISDRSSVNDVVDQLNYREFSPNAFLNLLNNKTYVKRLASKYPRLQIRKVVSSKQPLEGYLTPGAYSYDSRTSFNRLVDQMVARTNRNLKPYYHEINGYSFTIPQMMGLSYSLDESHLSGIDGHALSEILISHNDGRMHHFDFYVANANGKLLKRKRIIVDYNKHSSRRSYLTPKNVKTILSKRLDYQANSQKRFYFVINPATSNVYYLNNSLSNHQQIHRIVVKDDLLK